MRSRKELIYLNIKDITEEEKEALPDMELNCCDKCGEIDLSENLNWLEGEPFHDDLVAIKLLKEGNVSVCSDCWNEAQGKIKYKLVKNDENEETEELHSTNKEDAIGEGFAALGFRFVEYREE